MNTSVVVSFGTTCGICWMLAYLAIIYRGFKDRTCGMPVVALAANLSWEATYSFFLDPWGDYAHVLSIPLFVIDLVIAAQCLIYGGKDFTIPFVRKYFKGIFLAAVAIAFPIVYLGFYELHDPAGEYTGFAVNCMMSLLFVAMLLGRDGVCGQSLNIAVLKWLGTLFAYMATALTVTTDFAHQWPASLSAFVVGTVTHTSYPLTPLINVLYLVVFCADILYIALLYSRLSGLKLSPLRRI